MMKTLSWRDCCRPTSSGPWKSRVSSTTAGVEAGTLRNALDALAAAAFIVEPDGCIRFSNAAAEADSTAGTCCARPRGN